MPSTHRLRFITVALAVALGVVLGVQAGAGASATPRSSPLAQAIRSGVLRPVPGAHVRPATVSADSFGPYEIVSAMPAASTANGCLDADTNTMSHNGTIVQFWSCIGASNQLWYFTEDGSGVCSGCYLIQNADSGRYLDADTNTIHEDGTVVQLWDYTGSQANQLWFIYTHADQFDDTTWYAIENDSSGRVLDANLNTLPANGTRVQLWDFLGNGNQYWRP